MSPSYQVSIQVASDNQTAVLTPASKEDMPVNWLFNWDNLYQETDFDCQNIIKVVYADQNFGLIRYGLYPYADGTEPLYLEIEQIETNPACRFEINNRPIRPIGIWLIWYAVKLGLEKCVGTPTGVVILLTAKDKDTLIEYYRDIVQMKYERSAVIAPGEDGHVFTFSRQQAEQFCTRHEKQWGIPTLM